MSKRKQTQPIFDVKQTDAKQSFSNKFQEYVDTRSFKVTHNVGSFDGDLQKYRDAVDDVFLRMCEPSLEHARGDDMVHVTLDSPLFKGHKNSEFGLSSCLRRNFNHYVILDKINHLSQSEDVKALFDEDLTIHTRIIRSVRGRGKSLRTLDSVYSLKRSIVTIHGKNHCGYNSIALGLWRMNNPLHVLKNTALWKKLTRKDRGTGDLDALGQSLCTTAGVDFDSPMGHDELKKIQDSLDNVQILAVFRPSTAMQKHAANFLFKGPERTKKIFIEFIPEEEHYNLIVNVAAYFNKKFFCVGCYTSYEHKGHHTKCEARCRKCRCVANCDPSSPLVKCDVCLDTFYGEQCFKNHYAERCEKKKLCTKCKVTYDPKRRHICNQYYCTKCYKFFYGLNGRHECYIQPLDMGKIKKEDDTNRISVAFDIEAVAVPQSSTVKKFEANVLCAKIWCDKCWDYDTKCRTGDCEVCGDEDLVFAGKDCVKKFNDYIFEVLAPKKLEVLIYAHNFRGFDGHFVLQDFFERAPEALETLINGTKIIHMKSRNVKFIDSLNIFQQALDKLPYSFEFSHIVKKGFAPHKMNTHENFEAGDSRFPNQDLFEPERMSKKKRKEFLTWYASESQKGVLYNLKQELIDYCRNDVLVLQQALQIFRKELKDITGIDPLTRNFTLAMIAMETFRGIVLKPNTIGRTPIKPYGVARTRSIKEAAWLDMVEHNSGTKITRDGHMGRYYPDGIDLSNRKVYEFHGCYWHCHKDCKKGRSFTDPNEIVTRRDKKLRVGDVQQHDAEKSEQYRRNGFTEIVMWECEYETIFKASHPLVATYEKNYKELERAGHADHREALAGGRTNNLQFKYTCNQNEKIGYYDFVSLYPTVLYDSKFPVGHPQVIVPHHRGYDHTLRSYFGLVRCDVLAPDDEYLPSLPINVNGKQVYPLCQKCAIEKNKEPCHHEERLLSGTWTTPELFYAIDKKDYRIKKVYEVLHYTRSSTNIFKEYIKMFLLVKQESSGFPREDMTEEEKLAFIEDYFEKQGILLTLEKIIPNEGRRSIAKLLLNSLWGKLAQKPNQPQTAFCYNYDDLVKIVFDESLEIMGILDINENCRIVSYVKRDEEECRTGNTNFTVASYVTSYARLKLAELMDKVEGGKYPELNLLYFDTDSVHVVVRNGFPHVPTGEYLGCLTDEIYKELKHPEGYCNKTVYLGPKCYAMQMVKPGSNGLEYQWIIKTKGIVLTEKAQEVVNFESMEGATKKFITSNNNDNQPIPVPQTAFRTNPRTHDVSLVDFTKQLRVTSDKRVPIGNYTLPYGYSAYLEAMLLSNVNYVE